MDSAAAACQIRLHRVRRAYFYGYVAHWIAIVLRVLNAITDAPAQTYFPHYLAS